MDTLLKRAKEKNETVDFFHDCIDQTIEYFLNDDVYIDIYPALSGSLTQKDSPYFTATNITVAQDLTPEEYKTISYMAKFYKEKVKYNPKEIERYMARIGHKLPEHSVTTMVVDRGHAIETYSTLSCDCILEDLGADDGN